MEAHKPRLGSRRSDHLLRSPLRDALVSGLANGAGVEDLTEVILRTLSDFSVIDYAPRGTLGLLTTHGRVLIAVVERPDITMRELSAYLSTSESNVNKSVSALVRAKLLARTKVKGRNHYRINLEEVAYHPDSVRFLGTIGRLLQGASDDPSIAPPEPPPTATGDYTL